jgi:four helix bundle protein
MNQHSTPPSLRTTNRQLPLGGAKLKALEVAINLAADIAKIRFPKRTSHLRDHLTRAADNTALRLSEASGRTKGNRYQHLEAAYAESQEVQCDLQLLLARGVTVSPNLARQAERLGGLIYGLLKAEVRKRP